MSWKGMFSKNKNSNQNSNPQQQTQQQQGQGSQGQQQQQQYNAASTAMNIASDEKFQSYAADVGQKQEVQNAKTALKNDKGVQSGLKTMFVGHLTGNQDKVQQGQKQAMQSAYNNKDAKQAGKELLKDKEFRDKTAAMMKDQYSKNEDAIKHHAKQGASFGLKAEKYGLKQYANSNKK